MLQCNMTMEISMLEAFKLMGEAQLARIEGEQLLASWVCATVASGVKRAVRAAADLLLSDRLHPKFPG